LLASRVCLVALLLHGLPKRGYDVRDDHLRHASRCSFAQYLSVWRANPKGLTSSALLGHVPAGRKTRPTPRHTSHVPQYLSVPVSPSRWQALLARQRPRRDGQTPAANKFTGLTGTCCAARSHCSQRTPAIRTGRAAGGAGWMARTADTEHVHPGEDSERYRQHGDRVADELGDSLPLTQLTRRRHRSGSPVPPTLVCPQLRDTSGGDEHGAGGNEVESVTLAYERSWSTCYVLCGSR